MDGYCYGCGKFAPMIYLKAFCGVECALHFCKRVWKGAAHRGLPTV